MAWIKLPAVSVANGDIVVSVTGGVDLSSVLSGWALIINGNYVEIKSGTSLDGNGNSTLTLAEAWDGSTISNQPAKIMPTSAPALEIAQLMTDTNEFAIAVHNALEEYAMQDKDITLEAPNGETATFASLPKTERVMQAFRDAAGTAYAYDVTESATDTSNGANGQPRLLKRGDGGLLGKDPYSNTLSLLPNITHFSTQSVPTDPLDGITGSGNWWHTLKMMSPNTPSAIFSIKTHNTGGFPLSVPEAWIAGGFDVSRKTKLLSTANMVGTVTSDKTGAIIERGSNANGEYVKFADGTLICFGVRSASPVTSASNAFGSTSGISYFQSINVTFPHSFSNTPDVDANSNIAAAGSTAKAQSISSSSFTMIVTTSVNTQSGSAGFMAIGRWY